MKQILDVINKIQNTPKRSEKEFILKKYEDVEGLKEILKFVYDPMIKTGLAKKKMSKVIHFDSYLEIKNIEDAMKYLKENNTGNDYDIFVIQKFIDTFFDDDEKNFVRSIFIKDLPIGISRTTLNKVYGKDFIKKYSVMLASKYIKGKHDLSEGFTISLKLDGNRVTAFNREDGVTFLTRSGKEIEGLDEIAKEIERLPKNFIYDGEIIALNEEGLSSKDLFNKTQTIVRKKGLKTGLEFVVFDTIHLNDFEKGKSSLTYVERIPKLQSTLSKENFKNLRMVPIYYWGFDENKILEHLEIVESQGEEGLMINTYDGLYETKRSKSILKVKSFHTADLECIGVKEDIRGGKCGSITVMYKGYKVDVSGLKDREKELFWNNPDTIVGKIVEVKYKDESRNASGGLSLRFPNFVRIRDDKTLEDISIA